MSINDDLIEARAEARSAGRAEGIAEGRVEGKAEGRAVGQVFALKKMMNKRLSLEKAMDMLDVPTGDRPKYAAMPQG